jgi:bifunctional DNA-binding transcriptional regulator/antitoxin component of YhaV-PrlF toxin-antitoxin module
LSREEAAEFTAYVRREGRLTIPKELRDALIIKEGNLVKCKIIKVRAH